MIAEWCETSVGTMPVITYFCSRVWGATCDFSLLSAALLLINTCAPLTCIMQSKKKRAVKVLPGVGWFSKYGATADL